MYGLLKILSRICCGLSEKGARRAGRFLGMLFWILIPPKRKRLARDNILRAGITTDPKEAARIAKESALRFGPLGVTVFRFPLLTKENIFDYVRIEGKEYLDEAVKMKKGCILATTHCGNWELVGAALGLLEYPLLAVAMKQSNEGFDRFICEYRTLVGEVVEYKTGVRDMYRRLREGYIIGLLCDQDPGGRTGILSDFLGQRTLTPTGPAHFSVLSDAPVLPLFIHEEMPGKHCIHIEKPMDIPKGFSKKEAVQVMTDRINKKVGEWILRYPEEWFWLHNRWKWTDILYPEHKGTGS